MEAVADEWRASLSRALHPLFRTQGSCRSKTPGDTNWWFTVEDQPAPCFARLWKVDQDHDRVYAFCTTEPNPQVAPKHPKAMPVILLAEDQERWLTAPVEEALTS